MREQEQRLVALELTEARTLLAIAVRSLLVSADEADLVARLAALLVLAEAGRRTRP